MVQQHNIFHKFCIHSISVLYVFEFKELIFVFYVYVYNIKFKDNNRKNFTGFLCNIKLGVQKNFLNFLFQLKFIHSHSLEKLSDNHSFYQNLLSSSTRHGIYRKLRLLPPKHL